MRILIVDDEPDIRDVFRQCLNAGWGRQSGRPEIIHAADGAEAVDLVSKAGGNHFAVAFIASGGDGTETVGRIRAIDPRVNIVMMSGPADAVPVHIGRTAGPVDKLFHIAKPLDVDEVGALAATLAARWRDDREVSDLRAELVGNEMKALHLASHDPLTDAPNRLAFMHSLSGWVSGDIRFAMAILDLDRFKLVNDTYGHLAGDELIRTVCSRLNSTLPYGGTIARLGGDEFALLFPTLGQDVAVMEAERMLLACAGSFTIFGHSIQASASMGLVVIEPAMRPDPIDVMRCADLALNDAKRQGRGGVRVYDEAMDRAIRFRRKIEGGLSQAIANRELRMVYQPIVAHDTLDVVGFEALMRWQSEEYGIISPAQFIPIAEESNLIHDLGDWALGEALTMLERWPGQYVSVNFSPRQFRRSNFVGEIVALVEQAGISPARLQIEITETAIFDDAERAAETLYRLRQMGFRIALDDFGTGYSSLYNIRKFALDCLKIDKSFIDGMGREREAGAIVQSIIQLGRALGLEIVAEGVENEAQVQALRIAGCSHLQGYYLSHPLEAVDTLDVVRAVPEMIVALAPMPGAISR